MNIYLNDAYYLAHGEVLNDAALCLIMTSGWSILGMTSEVKVGPDCGAGSLQGW